MSFPGRMVGLGVQRLDRLGAGRFDIGVRPQVGTPMDPVSTPAAPHLVPNIRGFNGVNAHYKQHYGELVLQGGVRWATATL